MKLTSGKRSKNNKAFREIRRLAESYGFGFAGMNKQGHFIWQRGELLIPSTAKDGGDPRTMRNLRSLFRRGAETGDSRKTPRPHLTKEKNDDATACQ